jgi:hypothetical protein
MIQRPTVPKWALALLNNLCDIEQKLTNHGDYSNIGRNVDKIKDLLKEESIFYENPLGQKFNETRTDLDATITGVGTDNLYVVEVIKPIIRFGDDKFSVVVQKGVVVIQSRMSGEGAQEGGQNV